MDFFAKPAETDRLQDLENRDNTNKNNCNKAVMLNWPVFSLGGLDFPWEMFRGIFSGGCLGACSGKIFRKGVIFHEKFARRTVQCMSRSTSRITKTKSSRLILCNGLQINKCEIMNKHKHKPKSMPITVTSWKL